MDIFMNTKKLTALLLTFVMVFSLCACGAKEEAPVQTAAATEAATAEATTEAVAESAEVTLTDMIGREITVAPGSYQRVVCIGAGALRMYSYVGDVALPALRISIIPPFPSVP